MIVFIVDAKVKAGLADDLQKQPAKTTANIAQNEPNYALYTYFNSDQTSVTFINMASDSDALANHFAQAKLDAEGQKRLNSCIEIASMKLFGQLSPEVEAMVASMPLQRLVPDSGTFNRILVAEETVVN